MKGKEFLKRMENLESCIAMFNVSLSTKDGSRLTLNEEQQETIRGYLNSYRRLLLESEIGE